MIGKIPGRLETVLQELLLPGETVHIKLKGAQKEALICTDSRVIILKGGFMTGQAFGTNTFQLSYHDISNVEVKFHLLTGYFLLSSSGMQNTDKNYWSNKKGSDPMKAPNCLSLMGKDQAKQFQEASNFILQKVNQVRQSVTLSPEDTASTDSQNDTLAALEKLGQLKQAGVITEEEFTAKKSNLLARL